jgi:hypothetical protein
MRPADLLHGSSVRMTDYLIARTAIILWTSLAVMPAKIVFARLKPIWNAARSSYERSEPFLAPAF